MNITHLLRRTRSDVLRCGLLLGLAFASASSHAAEPPCLAPVLQPFVDNHLIAGAVVLVADADKVLDIEAVGWMDIAAKKKMRTDGVFWIASMTKPITCTALMMLVDEGKVDVDAPVSRYLPEFKDQMLIVERDDEHVLLKKPARQMLVRDLMSHTSGITSQQSLQGAANGEDMPLSTRVAAYAVHPLESEPGTKFHYTNGGMNTVGRLVEKVSGMSYAEFLQTRLFDPLGMIDTTFWPTDEQVARLPTGYRGTMDHSDLEPAPLDPFRHPLSDRTRQPMPAGGLFSTAADLAKFCQMILNQGTFAGRKYLSPERVKQMTSRQTAEGILEGYGFGWTVGGGMIAHAGAWKTNMAIHPKDGLVTIFMVQNSGWRDDDEGRKIEPAFRKSAWELFGHPPDLVIADFEGKDYGSWTTSGDAFGAGPVRGVDFDLPQPTQMVGRGFAASGVHGDMAMGTLTSPPFTIERNYIRFYLGGGTFPGETCMNLVVGGSVVRTAVARPGSGDRFEVQQWDVREFSGKSAVVEIVDHATRKFGHIEVDDIIQSDHSLIADASRTIKVDKRVLNLPVRNGGPVRRMSLIVNGTVQRTFSIELADGRPDWWVFTDLTPFAGQEATLQVDQLPENSSALAQMDQSDEPKEASTFYHEALRPQIHFTSQRGRLNDPNGLVFYQGEYHLFYQLLPYSLRIGEKHWGHAVSTDLVHWHELPVALYPDQLGPIYSGSAVVDFDNTAGFQAGKEKALVAIYTAAGNPHAQCLAYSNDRGRTWKKYEHNPVVPAITGGNRDPKVIRDGQQWIMIVYTGQDRFALLRSPNLKVWERVGEVVIPGDAECPELFQVPLDGNKGDTRWIVCGAKGLYLIGRFDGAQFTPESGPHSLNVGNSFYAAQTFNDIPSEDGRRILIPWSPADFPGMPFSQALGLPVELTLRTTADGPRLFAHPVKELDSLRAQTQLVKAQPIAAGKNRLVASAVEAFELEMEIDLGKANQIDLNLRGIPVSYNVTKQELTCQGRRAPLERGDGKIRLHIYGDRSSVDIFGNDGRVYMPMSVVFPPDNHALEIEAKGEGARILSCQWHDLKSVWSPSTVAGATTTEEKPAR